MSRINNPSSGVSIQNRLAAAADLKGNADGIASQQELEVLAAEAAEHSAAVYDLKANQRNEHLQGILGKSESSSIETLEPALQALPPSVQRLALEVDALWGNADGKISVQEIDRVAQYYLSALPFFVDKAETLVELAQHLNMGDELNPNGGKTAPSVLSLQAALAKLDNSEVAAAQPFRKLFDEAMEQADVAGAPELLREAANHNPKWHRLSVLEHTGKAVEAVRELSQTVGMDWKDGGATMLLHDVGKILDRQVRMDDTTEISFSFWDHEEDGARWLQERGVNDEIVFQIKNHSVLRKHTPEELIELAGNDPQRLGQMLVVYVSDQLAKGDTPSQLASLDKQRDKIIELSRFAGIDGEQLLQRADQLRTKWFA